MDVHCGINSQTSLARRRKTSQPRRQKRPSHGCARCTAGSSQSASGIPLVIPHCGSPAPFPVCSHTAPSRKYDPVAAPTAFRKTAAMPSCLARHPIAECIGRQLGNGFLFDFNQLGNCRTHALPHSRRTGGVAFYLKHLTILEQAACYNLASNDALDSYHALSVAPILWSPHS